MNILRLGKLALHGLQANKLRSVVASAGIGLGVSLLLVILALGMGIRQHVLQAVVGQLPVDTVEVIPKQVDLGLFQLESRDVLGGPRLDDATATILGRLPGVAKVFPKLPLDLPVGARGGAGLLGRELYSDLFVMGVPAALMQPEVGPTFVEGLGVVPVVISTQLLEIYNRSVAPSLGAPRLRADHLIGFEFELIVGESRILGRRGAGRKGIERARIVGVSRHAMRMGATIPLKTVRRLQRTYGLPASNTKAGAVRNGKSTADAPRYRSVLIQAQEPSDLPRILDAVAAMGLGVDHTAERTGQLMALAAALGALVGVLVLVLAGLNITHSFYEALTARQHELAVMRAVGAKRRQILLLVLSEAGLLGFAGGVVGVAGALLAGRLIDFGALTLLPDFPFKPDSFFVFTPWLLAAGVTAAVVAATGGAFWPAARAARISVTQGLKRG